MSYAYKIGPYHFDKAEDSQKKIFSDDAGGARTFSIVVSSAYNAGIIGSEYNGVVVLDEDNREVLLDRAGRPYDVAGQRALSNEFLMADWDSFCALLKAQPRFRSGAMPDMGDEAPAYIYPMAPEDDWTLIEKTTEGHGEDPIVYRSQTRTAIIKELIGHTMHSQRFGPSRLAWDIKVHSFDSSGKCEDYPGNLAFDSQWAAVVEDSDEDLFSIATGSALSYYLDGEYMTYPGDDQGDYKFEVEGRSGGWLVLSEVAGLSNLGWDSQSEMEDALLAMDADDLTKLYRVVVNLDHDVTADKIKTEMAYQYALERSRREEEWLDEAAPTAAPSP